MPFILRTAKTWGLGFINFSMQGPATQNPLQGGIAVWPAAATLNSADWSQFPADPRVPHQVAKYDVFFFPPPFHPSLPPPLLLLLFPSPPSSSLPPPPYPPLSPSLSPRLSAPLSISLLLSFSSLPFSTSIHPLVFSPCLLSPFVFSSFSPLVFPPSPQRYINCRVLCSRHSRSVRKIF